VQKFAAKIGDESMAMLPQQVWTVPIQQQQQRVQQHQQHDQQQQTDDLELYAVSDGSLGWLISTRV